MDAPPVLRPLELQHDSLDTILNGVNALDPVTYGAVAVLVTAISVAAVLVPARRATRVDPVVALRAQ